MEKLKILLPTLITSNPYVFQLIRSLQVHPDVEVVQYGLPWMKDSTFRFDIVHIQWPEVLFEWNEPDQNNVKFLEKTIARWKKENTKIVATVHNTIPHKRVNKHSTDIYKLVYNNCDAICHFGESSKNFIQHYFDDKSMPGIQQIIPHGNYTWFDNRVSRQQAREHLNIDPEQFMILVVGTIRKFEELRLLKQVAKHLEPYNGILYIAGRLPKISKRSISYYNKLLPVLKTKNIHIESDYIPDEEMQFYLNASDALFIPRLNSLNSGNVALGFTFGKVVIGNDYGVIGEELKKLGNPVFKPNSDASLKKAIEQSYRLSKSGTGENNRQYAMKEMDWGRIAEKHIEIYKGLFKSVLK